MNKGWTIASLQKAYRGRLISANEVAMEYKQRIKQQNRKLNVYLSTNPKPISGDGLLTGIPYALKDNINAKGFPTTCGSQILKGYQAPYSATVFDRLQASGAMLLGKTNLDEFAMGSSTEYSTFGATKNPWNPKCVPGGSSGGSAAAVASDLAVFALGSDTGGSVRQPAAFCGVVGFKPTYGVLSRYGLVALASSLDQIGTFTKTVEDTAILMDVLVGQDNLDATSLPIKADFRKTLKLKKRFTIGIVKEFFGKEIDNQIKKTVEQAIAKCGKQLKFKIKTVSLPRLDDLLAAYYIIQPAEASSNLARFDGVRYGLSFGNDNKIEDIFVMMEKTREAGFGEEVKRRIISGAFVLSSGYQDKYYNQAVSLRHQLIKSMDALFKKVDFLVGPTTPMTAFPFGKFDNDPVGMYYQDLLTIPANLAGVPAISIPVGFSSDNLPIGLQIIGPAKSDAKLLNCANQIEKCLKI